MPCATCCAPGRNTLDGMPMPDEYVPIPDTTDQLQRAELHYRAAETEMARAGQMANALGAQGAQVIHLQAAQVHATLALASVTAAAVVVP